MEQKQQQTIEQHIGCTVAKLESSTGICKCVPDLIFTTNKKNGSQQTKSPKNGGNKMTLQRTLDYMLSL